MVEPFSKTILICQNVTCTKQSSAKLLEILQQICPPEIVIEPVGCLGECGNGPMLLVMPEEIWYGNVQPEDLQAIIDSHLHQSKLFYAKLYRKSHHSQNSFPKSFWWLIFGGIAIGTGVFTWFLLGQTDYL